MVWHPFATETSVLVDIIDFFDLCEPVTLFMADLTDMAPWETIEARFMVLKIDIEFLLAASALLRV